MSISLLLLAMLTTKHTITRGLTGRIVLLLICLLFIVVHSSTWEGVSWSKPPPLSEEDIFDMIKKAGCKKDYPDDHSVVVLHHTDVSVEDTGLSHVTERRIVKILDVQGIKDNASVRFNYDPATQFLEIRWAKIFKADGKVVKVDLKNHVKDLPQPMRGIFWPSRMKVLDPHGLEPGDALGYEIYKKGFQIAYLLNPAGEGAGAAAAADEDESKYIPPMKGHYYDVILFEEPVPVKEKKYDIHIARSKPFHWEIYNGTVAAKHSFDDELDHFSWWKKDMAAKPSETRQPDRSDFVTKLVLATVKSWEEKSVWFFEINEPVFAFDDAIKKKVKQIMAGAKTDQEKVKRLLRWVAHKIRYSGITMGKGEGYTLHPGIMSFNDRCGVCKDIAGMLVTMMRAGGYEVYPAMTMAGARVEKIPADQFNHCVVAWKKKSGEFEMLDPTWMPYDTATWSYAEGQQDFLIGTKEGKDLEQTAPYKPEDNQFNITGSSTIKADGGLSGKFTFQGTGYADTRMRRAFSYKAVKEDEAFYHQLFSSISALIKIDKFKEGDWSNLDKQFSIDTSYSVPGYAAASKKSVRFVIPLAHMILRQERWSPYYMLGPWTERKNPAMFWFPQQITVKEKVKLPAGYKAQDLPEEMKFDGELVSYRFSVEVQGQTLSYSATWQIKERLAMPKHFDELGKLVAAIDKMDKMEIVLSTVKKDGGKKKGGGK